MMPQRAPVKGLRVRTRRAIQGPRSPSAMSSVVSEEGQSHTELMQTMQLLLPSMAESSQAPPAKGGPSLAQRARKGSETRRTKRKRRQTPAGGSAPDGSSTAGAIPRGRAQCSLTGDGIHGLRSDWSQGNDPGHAGHLAGVASEGGLLHDGEITIENGDADQLVQEVMNQLAGSRRTAMAPDAMVAGASTNNPDGETLSLQQAHKLVQEIQELAQMPGTVLRFHAMKALQKVEACSPRQLVIGFRTQSAHTLYLC